jgi:hypothetical protein
MGDVQHNGSSRPEPEPAGQSSPRAVPELHSDEGFGDFGAGSPTGPQRPAPVSDEDRNRFGLLLDRAAERGLLAPAEYQVRLRELAEATSVEEMTRIVSELPAFTEVPSAAKAKRPKAPHSEPLLASARPSEPRRNPPWALLLIVVVTIAVALVVLGLFAAHAIHTHSSGSQLVPASFSVPHL